MAKKNSEIATKVKLQELFSTIDHYKHWALFENGFHNQKFDRIAFAGASSIFTYKQENFEQLEKFLLANQNRYITCQINYNLKNEFEDLITSKAIDFDYPLLQLVVPELVLIMKNEEITCYSNSDLKNEALTNFYASNNKSASTFTPASTLKFQTEKTEYLGKIKAIKKHIQIGDVYELNYCVEAKGVSKNLNVIAAYQALRSLTEAPYGVLFKSNNNIAMCASPERFLYKKDTTLMAQPMKGTIQRSTDKNKDDALKNSLRLSEKEIAENAMIVDLMRNDFSRIAERGSVKTTSLFEVQTFKNVHQMISTVECRIKDQTTFTDILKATFPMGSMTGAPKIRAMQLIDEYESFSRDLFAGSLGYFIPGGNFDLNVVIRTVLYDAETGKISCRAGSAITSQSNDEQEYEECLLKLETTMKAVKSSV